MTQALDPDRGLLVVDLISLAVFGAAFLVFAVPYALGVRQARREGDAWSAFERRADGRWSPMVRPRTFAAFRAPEPARRTATGLRVRWGLWTVVVAGLLVYPLVLLVEILGLL